MCWNLSVKPTFTELFKQRYIDFYKVEKLRMVEKLPAERLKSINRKGRYYPCTYDTYELHAELERIWLPFWSVYLAEKFSDWQRSDTAEPMS